MQTAVQQVKIKVQVGDKVVEKWVEKWALDVYNNEQLHAQLRGTKNPQQRQKIKAAIQTMIDRDADYD